MDDNHLNEIPEPMGNFILNNDFKFTRTPKGNYYHYSEVCRILREYDRKRLLLFNVSGSVCGYYEARNTTDLKCRYCGRDKHEHEQTVR